MATTSKSTTRGRGGRARGAAGGRVLREQLAPPPRPPVSGGPELLVDGSPEPETRSEPVGRVGELVEEAASAGGAVSPAGGPARSVGALALSEASVSWAARQRNEGLRGATERATRIVSDVKEALESKAAGNLKREVRDLVLENLYLMQTLVYRLADSRNLLYEEVESGRARADCHLEKRHARALEGVLADYQSFGEELAAVRADTAAIREELSRAGDAGGIAVVGETRGITEQLKQLKRDVVTLRDRESRSYAEVARAVPRTVHTIVVSSRDPRHTADEVLRQIEGAVDARGSGVRVERCRKARDGKVLLGCAERADADKLAERLRVRAADLAVEKAVNKNPLVEIRDVLAFNKDEEIIDSIRKQNSHLTAGLDMGNESVRVRFRRRARNQLETHVVLEVSPQLWRRLVDAGAVYVGLQRRPVVDRSPLVQCSRCLAYGHPRRACRDECDACAHCGGEHTRAVCELLAAGAPPACVNCARERRPDTEREHVAFSDECPVRRRWDAIARSRVAYC